MTRLAMKRGFLSSVPTDELGTPSSSHVVEGDDGVAVKKKVGDGSSEAEAGDYGHIRGTVAFKRGKSTNQVYRLEVCRMKKTLFFSHLPACQPSWQNYLNCRRQADSLRATAPQTCVFTY